MSQLKTLFTIMTALGLATTANAASNRPADYTTICKSNDTCSVSASTNVAYGASGQFVYKVLSGSFVCNTATFGKDPIPSKSVKECSIPKSDSGSSTDDSSNSSPNNDSTSSSASDGCGAGGGATICLGAKSVSSSSISLEWTASGSPTNIQVYRDTDSDPSGRVRIAQLSNDTLSYTDTGLEAGKTYYYWIKFRKDTVNYNSGVASAKTSSSSTDSGNNDSGNNDSGSGTRAAKMEGYAAYAKVTGGKGGETVTVKTGTELNKALCDRASDSTPIIIKVNGTINHGNTTAQGCKTADDTIELKGKSNISIIGVGKNAIFDEIGIHIREAENIIVQNVHVRNVKKSGSPISNGGDAIGLEKDVTRVWLDHLNLEASGGEKDGYDSLVDMKNGVTYVTVSYTHFHDSSRAGLVGFNDNDVNNYVTFHHNWYENIQQRTPLVRNALVHTYNNYWSNPSIDYMYHAINSRANAQVLVEGNYFHNVNNPIIATKDSDVPGCWESGENTFTPEIYYSRTVANGKAHKDGNVQNGQVTSNCSVSVPYSYGLDKSKDVPAIVKANVGVGKI